MENGTFFHFFRLNTLKVCTFFKTPFSDTSSKKKSLIDSLRSLDRDLTTHHVSTRQQHTLTCHHDNNTHSTTTHTRHNQTQLLLNHHVTSTHTQQQHTLNNNTHSTQHNTQPSTKLNTYSTLASARVSCTRRFAPGSISSPPTSSSRSLRSRCLTGWNTTCKCAKQQRLKTLLRTR